MLDYSKEKFEVLVLDDSTDESRYLIDQKAAALKKQGLDIEVIRRKNRDGYKAGALQHSLGCCRGELIVLFDADFRPEPDFLKKLLPFFSDPAVGLVQARWGHLNRLQNSLTRIQSYLLDAYFSIEQVGRQQGGYFSNFCGTAGIWRKACIEDAGGWDGSVLSEDLDLSYRAQFRGWKIVYDQETEVAAELPSTFEAFKIQQLRWTKGIIQVGLKNGPRVATSDLPFWKKIHSFFHLTGSFVFPCLFINSLLSIPLLLLRQAYPEFIMLTNLAAIGGLNLIFMTIVFYQGSKEKDDGSFWKYYPLFLVVYMGMSVQNTIGVLEALLGRRSPFVRTPKYAAGPGTNAVYKVKAHYTQAFEIGFFLYFVFGAVLSIYLGDTFYLLLFAMMSAGLGIILFHTLPWRRFRWLPAFPKTGWRESMLPGDGQ